MKIRSGDKVKVIRGKNRGKVGKVLKVYTKDNRVLVEGVNIVKRHVKPGAVSKEGGIISVERPISASNVMLYEDKINVPVRLGYKILNNKKYRVSKKSNEVIQK